MFSLASASFFGIAGVGIVAAVLTAAGIGDTGGAALLLFVALAAVIAALAVFGAVGPDRAPAVAADAGAPQRRPLERPEVATSSIWPIALAVAVAVMAVGLAVDAGIVVLGVLIAIGAAFGWLAQSWREHPNWTPAMSRRINDRLIVPFGLPVAVIVLSGVAVVSFSRILLAVSKDVASLLALLAAIAILGACAFVALRPVGRRAIGALALVAVGLVLASGIVGAAKGEREFHQIGGGDTEVVEIGASSSAEFETDELRLPAETEVTVRFNNKEEGVPHNVAFYESEGGTEIFKGAIITGPLETEYEFETPGAGEYYFQCDVHPGMNGTLVVEEAAETPEGSAENSGAGEDH